MAVGQTVAESLYFALGGAFVLDTDGAAAADGMGGHDEVLDRKVCMKD